MPAFERGWLAQLGEHLPYKQRVGGSIPSPPTTSLTAHYAVRRVRQAPSAPTLER